MAHDDEPCEENQQQYASADEAKLLIERRHLVEGFSCTVSKERPSRVSLRLRDRVKPTIHAVDDPVALTCKPIPDIFRKTWRYAQACRWGQS
jgi:hypothetical protein